ncbi:hypothetical protein Nepgr_001356 [Nepenthes gracilis]|uniref:Uncharacterized protein n=1 Tax=Nepenthes gracilis TaxID=150966 RepID=A0AAD3P536_NEPGR|nr:hypothetical protein Nepgr_001356 [Nepenthes gracilis]
MAISAFKSTSKRGNLSSTTAPSQSTRESATDSRKKAPIRRSRSVSAFSRTNSDVDSGFMNKRENPLFWTAVSRPSDGQTGAVETSKLDEVSSKLIRPRLKVSSDGGDCADSRTGRPVSRYSEGGSKFSVAGGRSLLRVDTGRRRRSVSMGHNGKSESCSRIPNWEDGGSNSSISEAEEKTIRSVSEHTMGRHTIDDADAASGIVETFRTEVRQAISDIQNDLKNSQERARKLRAELAIEEHRGLELTKILKDIISDPKTPNVQKPRVGRKASIERRKMSKHLEEEALAYFDECVSISTFDGSDFSSLEDPPSNIVKITDPSGERANLREGSSSMSTVYCSNLNQEGLPANNRTEESPDRSTLRTQSGSIARFSFAHKQTDGSTLEHNIRDYYVKNFAKDNGNKSHCTLVGRSAHHDWYAYSRQIPSEQILFDRISFKKRIESGSLLLCCGSIGFPLPLF